MRDEKERQGKRSFQLVACVDGRGFGVRKRDMSQMLLATKGKVFTATTLGALVEHTDLVKWRSVDAVLIDPPFGVGADILPKRKR